MSKGMKRGMFPIRSVGFGFILLSTGWVMIRLTEWGWVAIALGALFVIGRPWYWISRGRYGAKASIAKSERKQERSDGVMSRWDHMSNYSATAMRIRWARSLQPGRRDLDGIAGWWRIFREPVTAYAACVGHSNYGGKYVPLNSVISRISAARSGKSQALMDRVIDHIGPLVATSTRGEIYEDTALLRQNHGPVVLFNAGQVGNHKSTLEWSVLSGCTEMDTAQRRAADLVGPIQEGTESSRWDKKAVEILGPLMYLAAHKGYRMRTVQRWIGAGQDEIDKVREQIREGLLDTPDGRFAIAGLEQFFKTNDRTRTSITSSLMIALAWLSNASTARLGDSPDSDFDVVRDVINANASVYILGGKKRSVAPLMSALVAEIVFQAAEEAERRPKGRLSPALLLALDEVPLTCPGPIDQWVLDMGGRGVTIDLIVQQRAGLDEIWGVNGRDIILGNSLAILFGAGCNSRSVAEDYAALSGMRTELRNSYDAKGELTGSTEVEVPVIDPGKLMALQTGEAIFFCRGRIDIIRTRRAETRKDVRRVKKGRRPSRFGRLSEESARAQAEFAQQLQEEVR